MGDASTGEGIGLTCVRSVVQLLGYRPYLCQADRTTAGALILASDWLAVSLGLEALSTALDGDASPSSPLEMTRPGNKDPVGSSSFAISVAYAVLPLVHICSS
ncbi:hypothetical protein B296_00042329 [Ensete ventricosum]|uniref:Uncharacterized protein n=1 Tax=Ensete ventricosum TaxID=4639 RepID=A0A426X8X1_ENSVE|nr:hypothetical protein B296_00042329 [Ensete ventricosum]